MTAAIVARSLSTTASPWISDAIVRTSYGVRFFDRAYDMLTDFQFWQNAFTCSVTSCLDVVFARKSYVAGKRNPSTFGCLCGAKHGMTSDLVATTYDARASATGLPFFRSAIFATAATRSAIVLRVKPSGKTIRKGFGGGGSAVVVGVAALWFRGSARATATTAAATATTTTMSAVNRRRLICAGVTRSRSAIAPDSPREDAPRRVRRHRPRAPT